MRKPSLAATLSGGLGLLAACLVIPQRTWAGGVVGNGTFDSCTEAALRAAVAGGGEVRFNCGAPTIIVTSPINILKDTTLDGGGRVTLSGAGQFTEVLFVGKRVIATVENLIISDAAEAIHSEGWLSVANSAFANNRGLGALDNDAGRLTVTDCTFDSNASGIWNAGRLTVTNSTFTSNGPTGAIRNLGGSLTVSNSTFASNAADDGGAAIYSFGSRRLDVAGCTFSNNTGANGGAINNGARKLTVTNSTFSNNHGAAGGAVMNFGQLVLINSTFSNNTADSGSAIINGGKVTLKNTLIAGGNAGDNCAMIDSTADRGGNLDSGTSCGFSSSRGSLSATDPLLDPAGLASNGGPTQTIKVVAGSPAINAGKQSFCNASPIKNRDQRGFLRPGSGSRCTIGAFEFNGPPH